LVLVVLLLRAIYGRLALSMISRELAVSSGINVDGINLVYLLLVSTVVAVGIKEVGTLLVGAVVIVPAAAARNVSSSLSKYSVLSGAFGIVSAMVGVLLAAFLALPAGPLVVLAGASLFAMGVALRFLHFNAWNTAVRGYRKKWTGGDSNPRPPPVWISLPRGWTVLDPYPTRLDYRPAIGGSTVCAL
jgi:ABC-type Mn2+/Zn2+ transport system permease subunit